MMQVHCGTLLKAGDGAVWSECSEEHAVLYWGFQFWMW